MQFLTQINHFCMNFCVPNNIKHAAYIKCILIEKTFIRNAKTAYIWVGVNCLRCMLWVTELPIPRRLAGRLSSVSAIYDGRRVREPESESEMRGGEEERRERPVSSETRDTQARRGCEELISWYLSYRYYQITKTRPGLQIKRVQL